MQRLSEGNTFLMTCMCIIRTEHAAQLSFAPPPLTLIPFQPTPPPSPLSLSVVYMKRRFIHLSKPPPLPCSLSLSLYLCKHTRLLYLPVADIGTPPYSPVLVTAPLALNNLFQETWSNMEPRDASKIPEKKAPRSGRERHHRTV